MAREASVRVSRGQTGQSVSVSNVSAATSSAIGADECLVYVNVECFVMAGSSPTVTTTTGTPLAANSMIRLTGIQPGDKLAFITASGTGTAYIRPGA